MELQARRRNKNTDPGDASREPDNDRAARPFILYDTQANTQVVTAVNGPARKLGLAPGRRLTDALACVPGIACAPAAPDEEAQAREQIARWLQAFGSRTGHEGNFFWIDITGIDHLFGSEQQLVQRIAARLQRRGFSARFAVAGNYALARALAASSAAPDGTPFISLTGNERTDTAPIPLPAALRCTATADRLAALGVRTVGDLVKLDRKELSQRFLRDSDGALVLDQLDILLGKRSEALTETQVEPRYFRQRTFFTPLTTAPAVTAALEFLLGRLCADLESEQADGRHFIVRFIRTDQSAHMVHIRTHRPTRAPKHLRGLLEEKLQQIDLGFGIETIRIEVLETLPFSDGGQSCLDPQTALAERQAEVLDRIGVRIGPERLLVYASPDAHHPHQRQQFVPALSDAPDTDKRAIHPRSIAAPKRTPSARTRVPTPTGPRHPESTADRPALMLPTAEPAQVTCGADGMPKALEWRARSHTVRRCEGGEQFAARWWTALLTGDETRTARSRDAEKMYYRIELENGTRLWLYSIDQVALLARNAHETANQNCAQTCAEQAPAPFSPVQEDSNDSDNDGHGASNSSGDCIKRSEGDGATFAHDPIQRSRWFVHGIFA